MFRTCGFLPLLSLALLFAPAGGASEPPTLRDQLGNPLNSLFDGIQETPAQAARFAPERQWWEYNAEKAAQLEKFPYASPLAACAVAAKAAAAAPAKPDQASPQLSCPGHPEPYMCGGGDLCDPEVCYGGLEQECTDHSAPCLCFVTQPNCSK